MPDTVSITFVLFVFYIAFSCQILLISLYFPNKIAARSRYVLENFPKEKYPKLYPSGYTGFSDDKGAHRLKVFVGVNRVIACFGFLILLAMLATDYRPKNEGGDEVFVLLYFALQALPLIYVAVKEYKQHQLMRANYNFTTRSANLERRNLSSFVSLAWVAAAAILLVAWILFYLHGTGLSAPWGGEVYATLIGSIGINAIYAAIIAHYLYGRKQDPYQSHDDRLRVIGLVIKILVLSSILISLFHIMTYAADLYEFEVFDPVISSLQNQVSIALALGLIFNSFKIETVNFDVYKKDVEPSAERTRA